MTREQEGLTASILSDLQFGGSGKHRPSKRVDLEPNQMDSGEAARLASNPAPLPPLTTTTLVPGGNGPVKSVRKKANEVGYD
jgi:hypothetical protein